MVLGRQGRRAGTDCDWWELASLVLRVLGTDLTRQTARARPGVSLPRLLPDTRVGVRWPSVGTNKQSHPPALSTQSISSEICEVNF